MYCFLGALLWLGKQCKEWNQASWNIWYHVLLPRGSSQSVKNQFFLTVMIPVLSTGIRAPMLELWGCENNSKIWWKNDSKIWWDRQCLLVVDQFRSLFWWDLECMRSSYLGFGWHWKKTFSTGGFLSRKSNQNVTFLPLRRWCLSAFDQSFEFVFKIQRRKKPWVKMKFPRIKSQERIKLAKGESTKKRNKNRSKRSGGRKRGWKVRKLLVNNRHCKNHYNHIHSWKGEWWRVEILEKEMVSFQN